MMDVLEISSDSNDTVLCPPELSIPSTSKSKSPKHDVEDIVRKYIAENGLESASSSDDSLVPSPKKPLESPQNSSYYSEEDDDLMTILSEKYKAPWKEQAQPLQFLSEGYSSESDLLGKTNFSNKGKQKLDKEALQKQKIEERKTRKQEEKINKAIKKAQASTRKDLKPEECLKLIHVKIDNELITQKYGEDIIRSLEEQNIEYTIKDQSFPQTITWSRKTQTYSVDDDGEVITSSDVCETEEILLIMNTNEFLEHVSKETLTAQIQSIKNASINKKVTLAAFGLQHYFRCQKNIKKNQISPNDRKTPQLSVSKNAVEFALTELQLVCSCSCRMVESNEEVGLMVAQFTKSIAQLPYKAKKRELQQQTDWYTSGDNRDTIKVDKNGNGLQRLWTQTLTTFPLARLETAEAIASKYPTPKSLTEAYAACPTENEGEVLLQDLPVRRAAGPIASVRKIGPELSKKIHKFYTSRCGDDLL